MTISGIYRIICKVNNKQYIGSACNIQIRKQNHFSYLKRNKHHSILLQRAYNKYGKDNFYFEILAYCPKEYLIKLEQWFLDNMKPEYNIQKIAGSNLGYKHTEATKKKLSLKRMGIKPSKDSIEKQRQKMLKFKHKLESIEKMKIIKKLQGSNHTLESKKKISDNTSIPVVKLDKEKNIVESYKSLKEAALKNNINPRTIYLNCRGKTKRQQKYKYEKDIVQNLDSN